MKKYLLVLFFTALLVVNVKGQIKISGKVLSETEKKPLAGANILLKNSNIKASTKADGSFTVQLSDLADTLLITFTGYNSYSLPVSSATAVPLNIYLQSSATALDEVQINTGYYKISPERATGSFTHLNNTQINRSVSPNIIDRLEGMANGLNFDRRHITENNQRNSRPKIQIRGVSTIESNEEPLIVVDNFPYEGDINTINPNDVESITILKDAAAASIWGARAGNGVIVITTKSGKYNQKTKITFNSSFNAGGKPDLFYNQKFLPSTAVMNIEKELFERGGTYPEESQTTIPLYVELLIKKRDDTISDAEFNSQQAAMQASDSRTEAERYLYRNSFAQQYSLNFRGGSNNYNYYLSSGYDNNRSFLTGDNNTRFNLNLQNTFQPVKNLELNAAIWYTGQSMENNGISFSDLQSGSIGISPYIKLSDDNGLALPIAKDYRMAYQQTAASLNLLDWLYRPLDELQLSDNGAKNTQVRINSGIKYTLLSNFNINASYQFVGSKNSTKVTYSPESYYVRNLVNKFTQADGTQIIPYGGILDGSQYETNSHSGRVQLNYSGTIKQEHALTALAGAEIRQVIAETLPGYRLYNYDSKTLTGNTNFNYATNYPSRPVGSLQISAPNAFQSILTDRYLSYFANFSDSYLDRYIVSGSIRWDGSNLFGVKANQKGVPLWSVGGAWEISREAFYPFANLPYLRIRATYGSSGNVNPNVSAFPTQRFNTDSRTGLQSAALTSAGNPNLRWEKVKTMNLGLDFGVLNNRIKGSIEYYVKNASDLIGIDYMDPTTGIIDDATPVLESRINYASLKTNGFDIDVTSHNLIGALKWETIFLFSYNQNKVTHFNTAKPNDITPYFSLPPPVIGRSRDIVYSLPWNGLDHQTGMPIVLYNGEASSDYQNYYLSRTISDLIVEGVNTPPYFGAIQNSVSFKNIQLSANIIWKAGYVFRRSSIAPGVEYIGSGNYHMDYFKRWKQPGDEMRTDVPASAETFDTYRAQVYNNSAGLITKGDHIRLQDINLSYTFNKQNLKRLPISQLRLYAYAQNLGILWRANKQGIDPDYVNAGYGAPASFAFGIQADF